MWILYGVHLDLSQSQQLEELNFNPYENIEKSPIAEKFSLQDYA